MEKTINFVDKYLRIFNSNTPVKDIPWFLPYDEDINRIEYDNRIEWFITDFSNNKFINITYDKINDKYYTVFSNISPFYNEITQNLPKLITCKDFVIYDNVDFKVFETPNPIDIIAASFNTPNNIIYEVNSYY